MRRAFEFGGKFTVDEHGQYSAINLYVKQNLRMIQQLGPDETATVNSRIEYTLNRDTELKIVSAIQRALEGVSPNSMKDKKEENKEE